MVPARTNPPRWKLSLAPGDNVRAETGSMNSGWIIYQPKSLAMHILEEYQTISICIHISSNNSYTVYIKPSNIIRTCTSNHIPTWYIFALSSRGMIISFSFQVQNLHLPKVGSSSFLDSLDLQWWHLDPGMDEVGSAHLPTPRK